MKIKKVSDIDLHNDLLLESILRSNPAFTQIIRRLSDDGDQIADRIRHRFIGNDITTNINYLSMGDANDEVKFVNDTQVQRMLDAGRDPYSVSRNSSKIGRAVRQLLTANNVTVTDAQIQDFVNKYKVIWDDINKPSNIELVSGEEIRKWYLDVKYVAGNGQLNNSCMRYNRCQPYLEIYVKNPDVCNLVILKDDDIENPKLLGRALLWKASVGCDFYLDRIYTVNDYDMDKIKNWVKNKIGPDKKLLIFGEATSDDYQTLSVKVSEVEFPKYPYFDTLFFLYPNLKELRSKNTSTDLIYQLRETDGGSCVLNWKFSRALDKYLSPDNAVYSDSTRDWYPADECVRDYKNNLIWRNDAVESTLYPPFINRHDAVTTEWGLVPSRELVYVRLSASRQVRMPKKFEGDKFFKITDRHGSTDYITEEHAFFDMFGVAYSKSDKRYYLDEERSDSRCLYKAYRINERNIQKLGEPEEMYVNNPGGVMCQVWALSGTQIPVALEYITASASTDRLSSQVHPEKIISGIIAIEKDIDLFGLTKKRASRGTRNPDIYMPGKSYMFDFYFHHPITESFKELVSAKVTEEEPRKSRIKFLDEINTYLCSISRNYIDNLRTATLRGITDNDLYRQVNTSLARHMKTQDRTFSTWLKNPTEAFTRNVQSLNAMVNDFNGRQPFGVEKKFNGELFKEWFTQNREMFVCHIFLWCISNNREAAAKSAVRKYGFRDRRSIAYLTNYFYSVNSRNFGDSVNSLCDSYYRYYRMNDGNSDPIAKFKLETAYSKIASLNERGILTEGLKAWELFKNENLPDLLA